LLARRFLIYSGKYDFSQKILIGARFDPTLRLCAAQPKRFAFGIVDLSPLAD
jgi:hypothetical protein